MERTLNKQMQDNTKKKIIAVATNLFLTKGYEDTRISDIIKGLGLTKGAIYHHFNSKEDIFNAVVEEIGNKNIQLFDEIKNDSSLNGVEKLSKIVHVSFSNKNIDMIIGISPNLLDSPKLLSSFINEINDVTIPKYIYPIVNEGVEDGSIHTKHSAELAEMIAVLLNIWLNPLIFKNETSSIFNKIEIMNAALDKFNIQLFDSSLIEKIKKVENKKI